jgi:hypothetical protein
VFQNPTILIPEGFQNKWRHRVVLHRLDPPQFPDCQLVRCRIAVVVEFITHFDRAWVYQGIRVFAVASRRGPAVAVRVNGARRGGVGNGQGDACA